MREKLAEQGCGSFPSANQVVHCVSSDTLPISTEYAAHRVIAR